MQAPLRERRGQEIKVVAEQVERAFNLHVWCFRILNWKALDINLRAGFKCACLCGVGSLFFQEGRD